MSWKEKVKKIWKFQLFFAPHYSDQMSEGSQVSKVTLCVKILKWHPPNQSVSQSLTKVMYRAAREAKNIRCGKILDVMFELCHAKEKYVVNNTVLPWDLFYKTILLQNQFSCNLHWFVVTPVLSPWHFYALSMWKLIEPKNSVEYKWQISGHVCCDTILT